MEDYYKALLNGPWSAMGHSLTVQPWSPSFSTGDENVAANAAWIWFPRMPILYYHKSVLRAISKTMGKFLKMDYSIDISQMGKFARMAVKLDMRRPLVFKIRVNGRIQVVEYEDFTPSLL